MMKLRATDGRTFNLREGSLVIGRNSQCTVPINVPNISKQHLQCYIDNGVVTIRDLGSSNGTFVNGNKVTSCVIKPGDEISLGGFKMILEDDSAPQQQAFEVEPGATVITNEPPRPQEPAPAGQINFDDKPGENDTPADGAFVPQAYVPPQQLQPQVVARDGKMFLRDPRTNREVEIIPKGKQGDPQVDGYYSGEKTKEKKKNLWLIGAAAGIALLMIVALTFTNQKPPKPVVPAKTFTVAQYNDAIDSAIDLMIERKFAEAAPLLRKAHEEYPQYKVAGMVLGICTEWEKSGKPIEEFNWFSLETSLKDLEVERWATTKAKNFAGDRIKWIYDLQNQQAIVDDALRLASTDPEKALAEFEKLPQGMVRDRNADEITKVKESCYTNRVRLAREAMLARNWDAANQNYTAAQLFATADQVPEIEKAKAEIQRLRGEEGVMAEVVQLMREDTRQSLQNARRRLAAISDDGPLAARKIQIRREIDSKLDGMDHKAKVSEALNLFETGRGDEAITFITQNRLSELYHIRTQIEKFNTLFAEAKEAEVLGDYDLAKEKWTEASKEETKATNQFHKTAVEKLAAYSDRERQKEIALHYSSKADEALQKEDGRTARKLYMKAMSWDPLGTIGSEGLRQMEKQADLVYRKAVDLRYKKQTEEAIRLFEKVVSLVEEGTDLHKQAKRNLSEMRTNP